MNINWNAITAISTAFLALFTLVLMLATIWLAAIALQAKNTWKEEIREKKKYDLIREMKIKLIILTSTVLYQAPTLIPCLRPTNEEVIEVNINIIKNTLEGIFKIVGRLGVIKQELDYLKCFKLSSKLNKLLEIIKMPPFWLNISTLTNASLHEEERLYIENLSKINKDEVNDLNKQIQKMCDEEIDKFYNY